MVTPKTPKKKAAKPATKAGARAQAFSMVPMKTSGLARSTNVSVATSKTKTVAGKAAAKKAAAKQPSGQHYTLKAQSGTYKVYGSQLRPQHITQEQIAKAVAELD